MQMPTPVVAYDDLYSNIIRRKWVGSGLIDHFPITRITVAQKSNEDYPQNSIMIQLNSEINYRFVLYREIAIHICDGPVVITLMTSTSPTMKYGQEMFDRFVTEDNDLFEKILKSVRLKGENGKLLGIKVDYDALKKKIQEIYFAPDRPSATFEVPYELVEAAPLPPIKETVQAQEPAVQSVPIVNPDAKDYDHQQGVTFVKHGKLYYKVYAEERKRDKQIQITVDPLNDKTTLSIEDWQGGIDANGVKWFTVYLDAEYHREPNVTEHYNDSASIKIAEVEEFSQKGTLGGTIPIPNGKITMLYNGAVTFDENFKMKYFKTTKEPQVKDEGKD